MYTFEIHNRAGMDIYREVKSKVRTEDGEPIETLAVLCAINYFGYDLDKDVFGDFERKTLEPFAKFLRTLPHYVKQDLYIKGIGESLQEMYEKSGGYILYPKLTRSYIMKELGIEGAEFKDIPEEFRSGKMLQKMRYDAYAAKYGERFKKQPHKCPCCGEHEFEYYGYQICPVCRYTDALIREPDPDDKAGYMYSLNEKRRMYKESLKEQAKA